MQENLRLEKYPFLWWVLRKHSSCLLINDGYVLCNLITVYVKLAAPLQPGGPGMTPVSGQCGTVVVLALTPASRWGRGRAVQA